jgi:hypothetical protein
MQRGALGQRVRLPISGVAEATIMPSSAVRKSVKKCAGELPAAALNPLRETVHKQRRTHDCGGEYFRLQCGRRTHLGVARTNVRSRRTVDCNRLMNNCSHLMSCCSRFMSNCSGLMSNCSRLTSNCSGLPSNCRRRPSQCRCHRSNCRRHPANCERQPSNCRRLERDARRELHLSAGLGGDRKPE